MHQRPGDGLGIPDASVVDHLRSPLVPTVSACYGWNPAGDRVRGGCRFLACQACG